jgi:hypothetical protein
MTPAKIACAQGRTGNRQDIKGQQNQLHSDSQGVSTQNSQHVQSNLHKYFDTNKQKKIKTPEKQENSKTPEKSNNSIKNKQYSKVASNTSTLRQLSITQYFSPPAHLIRVYHLPSTPTKSTMQRYCRVHTDKGSHRDLHTTSFQFESMSPSSTHPNSLQTIIRESTNPLSTMGSITQNNTDIPDQRFPHRQTKVTDFFKIVTCQPQTQVMHNEVMPPLPPRPPANLPKQGPSRGRKHALRAKLLKYTPSVDTLQQKITQYAIPLPSYELHDSWGHTLDTIDPSTIFQIFLQNPNGLSLSTTNYPLLQDFQTCRDYGAAVICLPETNMNWDQRDQQAILHQLLWRTWRTTATQTSRAPESFLSQYQPGGTATMVCNNWVSRVLQKGEDPMGLGRWSYITLRGKGAKQITVITAYNANPSQGDTIFSNNNNVSSPNYIGSITNKLHHIHVGSSS